MDIEPLMVRCEEARRRCEKKHGGYIDHFSVSYNPQLPKDNQWKSWMLWYVGFYEPDQGKRTETGETLAAALTAWLDNYEHRWD